VTGAGIAGKSGRFPFAKVAIGVAGILYLYVAAATISGAQDSLGGIGWAKVIGLALAPICVFCAIRYPIVFPFGLYVALVPFDALLTVSSTSSIVRFIGYAAFAAFTLRMLRLRTVLVPHASWYAWLALVAYSAISLVWTADYDNGSKTLGTIAMLFVLMTLLAMYPITKGEFRVIATLAVVFGVGAAAYCLKQYYGGHFSSELAPRLDLSSGDTAIDVNYLAGAFLLPMGLALGGLFYAKQAFIRVACCLSLVPFMGAIFVNGSREALFAAGAMFLFFAMRSKHRVLALVLGALCVGSIVFFPSILTRMFENNLADGSGRTEIWKAGLNTFADHWLVGGGLGSFQTIYDRSVLEVAMQNFPGWDRPAHSLVVEGLSEYGILGSGIIAFCWFLSFRQLRVIPKGSDLYGLRVACEATIIGYSVQALFIDPSYIKYVWLAHSLPLLLLNLYDPRAIGFRERSASPQFALRSARAHPGG
jgi:putative inorganic carbon (HCO3(-)) transporter